MKYTPEEKMSALSRKVHLGDTEHTCAPAVVLREATYPSDFCAEHLHPPGWRLGVLAGAGKIAGRVKQFRPKDRRK
jgi:hypothetical protein